MSPAVEQMSDQEFQVHALDVLQRELGLEGYARFLRLYRSGSGDYTRDRHHWLNGVTLDDVLKRLQQ